MAGQLAKSKGARVIGIAGGPEKCKSVVEDFGFDACIDYKNESIEDGLIRLCSNGIDSFFDNVGGPTMDAVL
jgi:NADPH-dependent curcumin reductase CurA